MKVEVELEDLEKIVFATAVIKQIETALSSRNNDPFVKPYLQYNTAHSNLTAAMTHAKRSKETYATPWDGELGDKEIRYLQALEMKYRCYGDFDTVTGRDRIEHREIDTLLAKGCIKLGTKLSGVIWTGDSQPDLQKLPEFVAAITARGKAKLEEVLMKRTKEAGLLKEAQEMLDEAKS